MAEDSNKSFFQTLPGIMTATATLITAAVGLITVLHQVGLIGDKNKEKAETEQVEPVGQNLTGSSQTADVEEMVRKVLKEESAGNNSDPKKVEATVREIVKDVKKEKGKSTPSKQNIEKMVRDAVDDFEEDEYHGEPYDDYGGSYGGSGVNVSGTWRDSNTGASYVFNQNGSSISFQEHSVNAYGQLIVSAEGSGTLSNRKIQVNYVTMFGTNGVASMTISPDGSNITGAFRDNVSGASMSMNLWR
ncbi:MAG: hypothetical protein R3E32_21150 [Chitinophagales bacterium]